MYVGNQFNLQFSFINYANSLIVWRHIFNTVEEDYIDHIQEPFE